MSGKKKVRLTLYRYAGKFLFFRIKERCNECDITYAVLQRLMSDQFHGKPVSLRIILTAGSCFHISTAMGSDMWAEM